MSEMEMFIGTVKRYTGPTITPTDTDDFYELEKVLGCNIVKVNGGLWCIEHLVDVDAYGFQIVIEPQTDLMFLGYWYNGGAGLHEVAEQAIRDYLEKGQP